MSLNLGDSNSVGLEPEFVFLTSWDDSEGVSDLETSDVVYTIMPYWLEK